jgi:hypothetical protein
MEGYCWRTYFSTYKAEISAGVLHASGPSEGSWVRRHVGASEFANSIWRFLVLIRPTMTFLSSSF